MKRKLSFLLAVLLCMACFAPAALAEGSGERHERAAVSVRAGNKPGNFKSYPSKSTYTTEESVVLRWDASRGAKKYGLTVVNDRTRKIVFDQYVTGTEKNIGKLPAGKYRFNMMAYNDYGTSRITTLSYFTVEETVKKDPPANFTSYPAKGTYTTEESVVLCWDASRGAIKYGLTVVNDRTGKIVFDQYVTGTEKNIGNLPAGKYRFNMMAYNDYGTSKITKLSYFTVEEAAKKQTQQSGGTQSSSVQNLTVGAKVTDFKSKDINGNSYYGADATTNCVSYALARMREKLGYKTRCKCLTINNGALASGDGKDVVTNVEKSDQNRKGTACKNSQTDTDYTVEVYLFSGRSHEEILACAQYFKGNALASFNSESYKIDGGAGHVLFIEGIRKTNDATYVQFSEGGNLSGCNGVLQELELGAFISRGGGLNGIANFIPMN